jgi:heterotetrameric sarcosine oxidase gamma subunit
MADTHDALSPPRTAGLNVTHVARMGVSSLRYFGRAGEFSSAIVSFLGVPLPQELGATAAPGVLGRAILAWCSPTETLMLCENEALIGQLQTHTAALDDGCVVDQTGGFTVLRASGAGVDELFARIGGQGCLPWIGESRRSRLAEVAVLALRIEPSEFFLVVERAYGTHLVGWISAHLAASSFWD